MTDEKTIEEQEAEAIFTASNGWKCVHIGKGANDNSRFLTLIHPDFPNTTIIAVSFPADDIFSSIAGFNMRGIDIFTSISNEYLKEISPEIQEEIKTAVQEMYDKAAGAQQEYNAKMREELINMMKEIFNDTEKN
jgi:hypothetical protein